MYTERWEIKNSTHDFFSAAAAATILIVISFDLTFVVCF
jgi:hypothetical protein